MSAPYDPSRVRLLTEVMAEVKHLWARKTFYARAKAGGIPGVFNLGGTWLVRLDDFGPWLMGDRSDGARSGRPVAVPAAFERPIERPVAAVGAAAATPRFSAARRFVARLDRDAMPARTGDDPDLAWESEAGDVAREFFRDPCAIRDMIRQLDEGDALLFDEDTGEPSRPGRVRQVRASLARHLRHLEGSPCA